MMSRAAIGMNGTNQFISSCCCDHYVVDAALENVKVQGTSSKNCTVVDLVYCTCSTNSKLTAIEQQPLGE